MTVSNNDAITPFLGDGTTKIFAYDFPVSSTDELQVFVDGLLIDPANYTASLSPQQVVFTTAPISGAQGGIIRATTLTQEITYSRTSNSMNVAALADQLDAIVTKLQEVERDAGFAIKRDYYNSTPMRLVGSVTTGGLFYVDANGNLTTSFSIDDIEQFKTDAETAATTATTKAAAASLSEDAATASANAAASSESNAANSATAAAASAASLNAANLMYKTTYDPQGLAGDVFDMDNMVEGADTKIMTAAERMKLAHITVAADIDLGDAVLNTATDASGYGFVLDEDDMASDSATKLPTQQSVKSFVETWAGPSAAWNSATAYVAGDKVSYNGAIWQANAPNTNAEPGVATEWDEFIPPFTGGTLTDPLTLAASTASRAGLNIPVGSAPSSPANGDLWNNGTAIVIRLAGTSSALAAQAFANDFTGTQKFSGVVKRKTGSLTLANGVNVGPTLPAEPFVRITGPTAAFSIASLTGAFDGQDVELYNTTAQVMTIKHQDSTDETTSPFKRIICPGGADITATVVRLHYDEVGSRWIVTSYR